MNKNRKKGDRFEYRTKKELEKLGWYVIRHPRSAFPDLIAIRDSVVNDLSMVLVVECKVKRKYFKRRERAELLALAQRLHAKPFLAYRIGRKFVLEPVKA